MSRKQFLILLAVLLVVTAAAAGVLLSERSAWSGAESRAGQKLFPALKIADVAEIALKDATGELHVVKSEGGWKIRERADFPAEPGRIGDLLLKMAELKVVQEESLPQDQRARLQLVEPKKGAGDGSATLLELKDTKGTVLARLLLGKKILRNSEGADTARGEDVAGRYVALDGASNTLLAVAEPLTQADPRATEWLVKDLMRVERTRTVTSTGGDGKRRWTIVRPNESLDWKFSGSSAKPDLQKVTDISSTLGWMDLVDVVADPAKADMGFAHGVTLKAETFDGLGYTVKIGNSSDNNYLVQIAVAGEPAKARVPEKNAKAADKAEKDKAFEERRKQLMEKIQREKGLERWTYRVAKTTLAPLLRDFKQLQAEAKRDGKKAKK